MAKKREYGREGSAAKRLLAVLAALTLVGSMAACAPSGQGNNGAGKQDKTLTVGLLGDTKGSLDPHGAASAAVSEMRWRQLYEGLTDFNDDGSLKWMLAESMTPSSDLKVWTIKLRPGVKFQDGSSFGADDVIFSIKRILDPSRVAQGQKLISFVDPEGLRKVDDLTVEMTLKEPYGPLPTLWTNIYLLMVPKTFDPMKPVGTGPFKFVSVTTGQQTVLERSSLYWGTKPGFKTLKVLEFPGMEAIANALMGGQIDATDQVPFSQVKSLSTRQGIVVDRVPANYKQIIYLRSDLAPFNDVRVRQALRLIYDRQQVVDNAYAGFAEVASDASVRSGACLPKLPKRTQDIAKAKQLLSDAGQSNLSFEIATAHGQPGTIEMAQIYVENAKKAGLNVTVKEMDAAGYLSKWGQWPVGMNYSTAPYLNYVRSNLLPGGGNNAGHWADPEFIELANKLFVTADPAAQCDLQKQMLTIEYERGTDIIPVFIDILVAHKNSVTGFAKPLYGYPLFNLRNVTIK